MKKNGYTALEMLVVIVVLGVFTIGILSATSYAYQDRSIIYYEEIEHIIEKEAKLYGEREIINSVKNEGNLVITLNDLVTAGYYVADDKEGNVIDPRNSKATLNGLKIKLTYEVDNTITAKVIEED